MVSKQLFSIPTIETERLYLREFHLADFEVYAQIMADPQYVKYLGKGVPLSRELAWRAYCAMIGHWHLRGYGFWAIEVKDTGEYVGQVGLHYPEGWPAIELGWGIKPSAQGKGYAFEAANRALSYGFDELQLKSLISLIVKGNEASTKLAIKLGHEYQETVEMVGRQVAIYKNFSHIK